MSKIGLRCILSCSKVGLEPTFHVAMAFLVTEERVNKNDNDKDFYTQNMKNVPRICKNEKYAVGHLLLDLWNTLEQLVNFVLTQNMA